HRMELYVHPDIAPRIIDISRSFNIDAQVIGYVEEGPLSLIIHSDLGTFKY
ncbi:MAG: phosphoribosylformylglycinamidine cyclo-ligase, partial [Prevotella sp.]